MPNQYDETKKMLNRIRSLIKENESNFFEQESEVPDSDMKDDVFVVNDVDVKMISQDSADLSLNDEQKNSLKQVVDNFRSQVSQIVDLEPGFTLKPDEIRLDGTLKDDEIIFTIIAGVNDGVYINANMTLLSDECIDTLNKLKKFEDVFKTAMEPLINARKNNIPDNTNI